MRTFKNYVHYTSPEDGQVYRFAPGEHCPEEFELDIDPNNFFSDEEIGGTPAKVNYSKLTKEELVQLAAERGLDPEGTKAELADRLEKSDAAVS